MADVSLLIDRLSAQALPARRLPSPTIRLLRWALLSFAMILLSTTWHDVRNDLSAMVADPIWLIEQGLALTTSLLAGFAAISFSVPGRQNWERLMWIPAATFWMLVLLQSGHSGADDGELVSMVHMFCPYCFPVVSIGSAVFLAVDIRKAAPVAPVRMMALLLVAGSSNAVFGERLTHNDLDASILIAIQVVAVLALGAMLAPLGRLLFRWRRR